MHGNEPLTAKGSLPGDPRPPSVAEIAADRRALEDVIAQCSSASIRDELERAPSDAARLAICEDSLHHQRHAWPPGLLPIRPQADPSGVRITLPLPAEAYRSARPVDARWTRPPEPTRPQA
jgi:hypothetical protein